MPKTSAQSTIREIDRHTERRPSKNSEIGSFKKKKRQFPNQLARPKKNIILFFRRPKGMTP